MAVARKLKDPDAPITRRSPAEIALQAKRIELEDYREAHKRAVAAQLANEQSAQASAQRDAGLAVEKRKADFFDARRALKDKKLVHTYGDRWYIT